MKESVRKPHRYSTAGKVGAERKDPGDADAMVVEETTMEEPESDAAEEKEVIAEVRKCLSYY